MLVKYREGKVSSRITGRIWLADRELEKTCFTPGTAFDCKFDEKSNIIKITPGGSRKVSKRDEGDKTRSIIDIKTLRVKHSLKNCDYITIEIYCDNIVIKGRKKDNKTKTEEYQKQTTPVELTSFSFFETDAPAIEAGFISKGCLIENDENITYSVPITNFQADILPKADAWFINLRNANNISLYGAHFIRLFSQIQPEKKPYSLLFSPANKALDFVSSFLQNNGYKIQKESNNLFLSIFEPAPTTNYKNVYKTLLKNLDTIPKNIPITMVSFYSGCISDLSFKEQDFTIKRAYDLTKEIVKTIPSMQTEDFANPQKTYIANIGDEFFGADIPKLELDKIPEADFYFLSPVCKGFSKVNRITGFLNNPKNEHMRIAFRIIKNKKPKVFAMEQVPEVLTAGNGIFLEEMKSELSDYHLTYKVVNAADLGSAQHRKRVIFLGSRLGEISFPVAKQPPKSVGEAFDGITPDLFNQTDITKNNPKTIERMKHIPQGGNWEHIPQSLRSPGMGQSTQSNIYKRLHPDNPSCTIVNYRKTSLIHPFENRGLSVREAARLMDLPDLYEFFGSINEMQQQIGNGIPLAISNVVADTVKKHFQQHMLSLPTILPKPAPYIIADSGQLAISF